MYQGVPNKVWSGGFVYHQPPKTPPATHTADTPCHIAAQLGYELMVDLLLNQDPPADPNVEDAFDNTPIQKAAEFGHAGVVQILIDAKANVMDRDQYGRCMLETNESACSLYRPVVLRPSET